MSNAILRALIIGLVPCTALAQRITFDVQDASLKDVVTLIERAADVTLEPAWTTRSAHGLDPDALVTLHVQGLTFEQALDKLCSTISDDLDAPTWQRTDDAFEIGPRSRLNHRQTVVVYDVRDLLHVVPTFDDTPELDLQAALSAKGGGGSVFQNESSPIRWGQTDDEATPVEEIADLVRTFVEPEQWRWVGGDGAFMKIYHDTLIVRAPGYVHRQIAD